ncbi:MAG: hypothetical protein KC486_26875 [Myxococcales bacterium]|nr:hypothetical protein [Myxococcales bacterium]
MLHTPPPTSGPPPVSRTFCTVADEPRSAPLALVLVLVSALRRRLHA